MFQSLLKKYNPAFLLLGIVLVFTGSPIGRADSTDAAVQSDNLTEEYPREISVRQAASKKVDGATILDVRELHEFVQGHIPGAVMIPLGVLEQRVHELPKGKEIVVVCLSGGRSRVGLDIIRKAGYNKSSNLAGGMNAWKAAGYPTVTGR